MSDNSVQIVLIGATGSGKSSTGNTILGKKLFRSEASAKSVTRECEIAADVINGWQVKVVDTPGWNCTALTEQQSISQIKQSLLSFDGPYSFLLVIRIGSMESKEEINQLYKLKSVLGPSFLDHTTILFSRSDDLEGKAFSDFIVEGGKEFQDLLNQCGRRCHCWNNRENRSNEAVEKLLGHLKMTELKNPGSQDKMNTAEKPSASVFHGELQENVATNRKRSREPTGLETCMSENQINVLFLGRNRVGKTSSIKTLGGKSVQSGTEDVVYIHPSSGPSLKLIESPGFEDNREQIQAAISKSVSDCSPGPHVIIIVLSVERFTPAAQTAMKHVQDCLGKNARKHTMILFTRVDNLEGQTVESFIQTNQHLKELVKTHENRLHALNNRDAGNETQVNELLRKINAIYEQNNKDIYTTEQLCPDSHHQKETASTRSSFISSAKPFLQNAAPKSSYKNKQDSHV